MVWLVAVVAVAFVSACSSTVTPKAVFAGQASFDQGEQNSGTLSQVSGGFVITAHARDRYNALIAKYGRDFLPPIEADAGITPREGHGDNATFTITNEALQNFRLMNAWRRMNREPGDPKNK